VSLILDALKKLEREKNPREPGCWSWVRAMGEGRRSRRPLALAAAGLLALAFAAWWWWRPAPHKSAGAPRRRRRRRLIPGGDRHAGSSESVLDARTRLHGPGTSGPPSRHPDSRRDSGPARPSREAPPAAGAPDDLRLNAITRRDGRPVALVNDRLVFEGDSFDGVKILRIGEAEVEVEVHGRRRVLRF